MLKPSGLSSGGAHHQVHHVPYRHQHDSRDEQDRAPPFGGGLSQQRRPQRRSDPYLRNRGAQVYEAYTLYLPGPGPNKGIPTVRVSRYSATIARLPAMPPSKAIRVGQTSTRGA